MGRGKMLSIIARFGGGGGRSTGAGWNAGN